MRLTVGPNESENDNEESQTDGDGEYVSASRRSEHGLVQRWQLVEEQEGREERTHTFDEGWQGPAAPWNQHLTTGAGTSFVTRSKITSRRP